VVIFAANLLEVLDGLGGELHGLFTIAYGQGKATRVMLRAGI